MLSGFDEAESLWRGGNEVTEPEDEWVSGMLSVTVWCKPNDSHWKGEQGGWASGGLHEVIYMKVFSLTFNTKHGAK